MNLDEGLPRPTQRPNTEMPVDGGNEQVILKHLLPLWNYDKAHKLRNVYHLDYALLRFGTVGAFIEIKCRPTKPFDDGDGLELSLSKVLKARELTMTTGRPCFFFSWLADGGIYWRSMDDQVADYRLKIFGRANAMNRTHEGVWEPNPEPCVVYPWDTFQRLVTLDSGPTAHR